MGVDRVRKRADNDLTDDRLEILLGTYSETDGNWGVAGGLATVPDIVDAAHEFINNTNVISTGTSCFISGEGEYLWTVFSNVWGSQCVEKGLIMEGFLKLMGIEATAIQIIASNDGLNVPVQTMTTNPIDLYKERPIGDPSEWLLMIFGGRINEGEGVTVVDINQGDEANPSLEQYYPQNFTELDDNTRRQLISSSPCEVLTNIRTHVGGDFQIWCGFAPDLFTPPECSDLEPVPTCE